MPELYPLLLKLNDKNILIFGGGNVSLRKAKALIQEKACLTVISPHFLPEFHSLKKEANLNLIMRCGKISDVKKKYFLILSATDDKNFNHNVTKTALKKNILCNNVSEPQQQKSLSTFRNTMYITRFPFIISVFSSGNPKLSQQFLVDIEQKLLPIYLHKSSHDKKE